MIKFGSIVYLFSLLVFSQIVFGKEALRAELSIFQYDSSLESNFLLYSDTVDFFKDIEASGYISGLSFDIAYYEHDSNSVDFTIHVRTHAPLSTNRARQFNVELGLPAKIDSLMGKNNREYIFSVKPLEVVDRVSKGCDYSQRNSDDFQIGPSAHLDIYYVPNSLADYFYNSIKGMMEEEYDRLNKLFHFSLPGKYILYMVPCKLPSIIWDDRFGMMVDPTRSSLYGVYSNEYNSVDPFLIAQAAILKNLGYAPSFLTEGLAGYLSLAPFKLKQYLANGELISIDSLFGSYNFYKADPLITDRVAAGFVKYLLDQYKLAPFLDLYKRADDLNLRTTIESVYKKPIAELESEWHNWIDTVQIQFGQFAYYQTRAETMRNYRLMNEYSHEMLKLASSSSDSLAALRLLVRGSFFTGRYDDAVNYQEKVIGPDGEGVRDIMALAGYKMMNGDYNSAGTLLDKAITRDSTDRLVRFNKALCSLYQKDSLTAKTILSSLIEQSNKPDARYESLVTLGMILLKSGIEEEKAKAITWFNEVITIVSRQRQQHNPSASTFMWLGIAYLGVDDTGSAQDALQTAKFLESRSFYKGMIDLWLGKVADLRGERDVAVDHYNNVVKNKSAQYHKDEAMSLLETPYRQ